MTIDLELLHRLAVGSLAVLLDAAVKGTVVLAAAGVLALALRKASAAARHAVWLGALASLLVLPPASAALPGWQVLPGWARLQAPAPADSTGPTEAASPVQAQAPADVAPEAASSPRAGIGTPPVSPVAPAAAPRGPSPAPAAGPAGPARGTPVVPWLTVFWAAGAAGCLVPLMLGRLSLWRLARASRRIEGGLWEPLVQRAARAVGLRRRVVLLQSDTEPVPMVWGILQPKLLVPGEAEGWSAGRRWVVLVHELAHARRHDCLTKLVAHVACAAYWFNPLCWVAFKRMQHEAESACDDLVLAAGHGPTDAGDIRPSDYAQHLLEIASGLKSGILTAYSSIAMARRSKLEGRLLAILDSGRNRRALTRPGVLLAAVLLAAVVVPLSVLKATAPPATQPAANRLEFRVVPNGIGSSKAPAMTPFAGKLLEALRKEGPAAAGPRGGEFRWFELVGEVNSGSAVMGEHGGRRYILLATRAPHVMLPGRGKDAWAVANVYATAGPSGRLGVGFELDDRGAELLAAFTKANIGNAVAILVDGKVVSAPVVRSALGRKGIISGRFSRQEVQGLVKALSAGMPPGTSPATQPAPAPVDEHQAILIEAAKLDLERARIELARVQAAVVQARATQAELAAAQSGVRMAEIAVEAAMAEAKGDALGALRLRVEAAQVKLAQRRQQLDAALNAWQVGKATVDEAEQARLDVRLEEVALALAKAEASGDVLQQARLRVEAAQVSLTGLRGRLERLEAAHRVGKATRDKVDLAALDVRMGELQLRDAQAELAQVERRVKETARPAPTSRATRPQPR